MIRGNKLSVTQPKSIENQFLLGVMIHRLPAAIEKSSDPNEAVAVKRAAFVDGYK
jgi:hypothetical protein